MASSDTAAVLRSCDHSRSWLYAPHADMLWCETSEPDIAEARRFAEGIHKEFPGKLLAYNCSPSFHWRRKLDEAVDRDLPA